MMPTDVCIWCHRVLYGIFKTVCTVQLLLISFQGKECAHLATDSSLIIVCVCAFADLAHCVASTAVQCTFLWLLRFTLFMLTKFAS